MLPVHEVKKKTQELQYNALHKLEKQEADEKDDEHDASTDWRIPAQ